MPFCFFQFWTQKMLMLIGSQRLCLTIHTKHSGHRKECFTSIGLVKEKKPWSADLNLIHWIDWGVVSSLFFSRGIPICEYKAAVTHKYYMVWRCKAGINDWGVCVRERLCDEGPHGILLRQAGMVRVWSHYLPQCRQYFFPIVSTGIHDFGPVSQPVCSSSMLHFSDRFYLNCYLVVAYILF